MTPEEFEKEKRRASWIAAGEFFLFATPFAIMLLIAYLDNCWRPS